jgi:hypothetical protein
VIRQFVRGAVMVAVVAVGLVALPSAAGAVPIPWKNCGSASDLIRVSKADASVWPPQAGKSITLSIDFTLGESISGGYAFIAVGPMTGSSFQPVEPLVVPLRAEKAGPYAPENGPNGITLMVPQAAAGMIYSASFDARDTAGARLICAQATVPIKGTPVVGSGANPAPGHVLPSQPLIPAMFAELWEILSRSL